MNLSSQKMDGVNNSSDSKLQIKERVNVSITRSIDGSILLLKKVPVYEGSDVEDALWAFKSEAKLIPKVNLKIIPSLWGHIAGADFAREDAVFINNEIIQFFE